MINLFLALSLIILPTTFSVSYSQTTLNFNLKWKVTEGETKILSFNNNLTYNLLKNPTFNHIIDIDNQNEITPSVTIIRERKLTSIELTCLNINQEQLTTLNKPKASYPSFRKNKKAFISFSPIYLKNNIPYVIEEFNLSYQEAYAANNNTYNRSNNFSTTSVFSNTDLYKLEIINTGVHKITYESLISKNIISGSISSNLINIYGNHNGMLPEQNNGFRHDDLKKNAIYIEDGNDGVFGSGDYILFYAEEINKWKLNSGNNAFFYDQHLYDTKAYCFLSVNDGSGAKRIASQTSSTSSANQTMTSFNAYQGREIERYNLMFDNNRGGSGKEWYGEVFDVQLNYAFNFNFPNIDPTQNVIVKTALLAYTPGTASSYFQVNAGSTSDNISIAGIPQGSHSSLASKGNSTLTFQTSSSNIPVNISFTKATGGNSKGWLDYIEVNAKRRLIMHANQLSFRDLSTVGTGNITQFDLQNATNVQKIWDITNPIEVIECNYTSSGSTKSFVFTSDTLRTFIAFNNNNYLTPTILSKLEKQNLHGQTPSDMIIVYHPNFKSAVDKLENFHVSKGLTVVKASVQEIYNEFSSGSQDITAIKTYARMLYEKGGANPPKYLLLFGDGSFDYKGRVSPNHNFVPVWESQASLNDLSSYTSDDFFGILDVNEGIGDSDLMDVSVGRLTVRSATEANVVVDKIINYQKEGVSLEELKQCNTTNSGNSYGDWRNILTFLTDDVDESWEMSFFNHAEKVMDSITKNYPVFNLSKLHMDAYKQESTPGGERYPVGAEELRRRVENGSLIVAYEGHGGEVGFAHERILDLATINSWTNYNRLPIFLTATCEFTKYDDPSRTSAGEQLFLNPNGGCIALFTTTRAVFQSANERLIEAFFEEVFVKKADGSPRTLGDVYLLTKNHPSVIGNNNSRKFGLVGDPALDIAYPKHKVITQTVNGIPITSNIDTLKALSKVTITGIVANENDNIISSYNGFVYPTVYDKAKTFSTLGNYSPSFIRDFEIQSSVLYKGKATVTNGQFSYTFIVPKDINYVFGNGKLSYYAFNGNEDAGGYEDRITVGGTNNNATLDEKGPEIDLFLNNKNFVSGGITDENPTIYAEIFDSNGINTTGNGIGHDITAVIDGNTNQAIVLNNSYESDADTYQSGKISYPLSSVAEGNHTLTLKTWDVHNNSSDKTIDFVVVKNEQLAIDHVLNYPNPFTTRTQFFFEHNQACEFLDAQVQIFTVSGKLVKTINKRVQTHGYRTDPIEWNGTDDYGDNIGKGTYVYRVKVTDNDGNKVEKFEKLVILK